MKQDNKLSQDTRFKSDVSEVEDVESFKYLGTHLTKDNDGLMTVLENINKSKRQWGKLRTFLCKETNSIRTHGNFYKVIVKSTLLFGS